MAIKVDEVIVGSAPSPLPHLYYPTKASCPRSGTRCFVIGKDALWKKIAKSDPNHRFGQPPQIVHVKGNQATVNKPTFQTASDVDAQLDLMRKFLDECGVDFV